MTAAYRKNKYQLRFRGLDSVHLTFEEVAGGCHPRDGYGG
jgi:hypothetical protein